MELLKIFFEPIAQPNEIKSAEREQGLEEIKRNYGPVLALRELQYDEDVKAKPEMKNQRLNLDTHNQIVLGYADELIEANNLSGADKVAAYLAVIFHDSGKLAVGLMEHHLKSKEYAEKLLDELPPIKQDGETIKITPELKEKVLQAIERHMNHPFLIEKKGERFPEPESEIDKIVFDADMMANVGFKNVCFRLINKDYLKEDAAAASGKGISALEESFNNVMEGVRALDKVVLSTPAKMRTKELVNAAEDIFKYLKDKNIFQEIQDKYSENNEFNFRTINQKPGGTPALKEELNTAIIAAAKALDIDGRVAKNFIM